MRKQCLIVRGGWSGHDPVGATEVFLPFLDDAGYRVDIEDTPEVYADAAAMSRYDLVVQCVTMGSATVDEISGLRQAVASGVGLAGWHGGLIDSFRASPDYLQLVGAQFAAHPHAAEDRGRTDVEAYRSYEVTFTPSGVDHPVTAGAADFDVTTEQYWVLSDGLNDILATSQLVPGSGDEWHGAVTMPVAWARHWGSGRIFGTALGHTVDVLTMPQVRGLIERGMLWASR